MLRIAVTYTGTDVKQQNYLNWLMETVDCEAITVSAADPHRSEWSAFDGLLLSGGIDVNPAVYGGANEYPNSPGTFHDDRDAFEREFYAFALGREMPVLGVCRGMQLINAISGGTLTQDLGNEGNELHRAVPSDKRHRVTVVPGTALHAILRGDSPGTTDVYEINSAHHQCVLSPAVGFRVSAWSPEGVPEALEPIVPGPSYLFGVQWHPERLYQQDLGRSPVSWSIRDSFLLAAKHFQNKTRQQAIN